MSRLVHSERGFIRSLEISTHNFFAFVEGGTDRPYYDRILERTFEHRPISYQVRSSRELPGGTGGKIPLLSLFRTLKRTGRLKGDGFGTKFTTVFFVDKDVDDLARKMLRSDHVVYTKTYDVEGQLFQCCDLIRAVADAAGLTFAQANHALGDQSVWIRTHVELWADWVTLCSISLIRNLNCGCTFERSSAINDNVLSPVDSLKLEAFKDSLGSALGVNREEFDRVYERHHRRIIQSIRSGAPLRFFKGKWLPTMLQRYLHIHTKIPDSKKDRIAGTVVEVLTSQVGTKADCRCLELTAPALQRLAEHVA